MQIILMRWTIYGRGVRGAKQRFYTSLVLEKTDPDARDNFRRLADKYRKLKKNHKILYWILNNV